MYSFSKTLSLVSVFLVSFAVQAEVSVSEVWNSDISDAKFYRIESTTQRVTYDQVLDVVGKKIRQNVYRNGVQVDSYEVTESTLKDSIRDLRTTEGEFKAITPHEVGMIRNFVEKNDARVYVAEMATNYMGGGGLERIYLYVSQEKDLVLGVQKFYYSE